MKKYLGALLSAVLIISILHTAALGGFDRIENSGKYSPGMFGDVSQTDWFAPYIAAAVDCGLADGKGGGVFEPAGSLTLGEAVKLAASLRSLYYDDGVVFLPGEPFYSVYADYALEHGIIDEHGYYDKNITRIEFARLIRNALPVEVFGAINDIGDNAICDVTGESGRAVYDLYRAGILSGSDRYGTFYPERTLTRAEACAVLARVIEPGLRVNIKLPRELPGEEIYKRSADAVIMLELFNEVGETIRTGSGFFISRDGLAVTNEHVIAGAVNAIATLNNGRKYPVLGVCSVSAEYDLAVILIDIGDEEPGVLSLSDSEVIETGAGIYALGSPLELLNSISAGVVANSGRELGDMAYFQFTASISFGSGGGPVLNSLGQVIGVACSSFTDGQRLNLAVPISLLFDMEIGDCVPLS